MPRRSYDRAMPVWRCPHCGTPQAESSRCWVCRRSTTTCATCLHFRRGIASGLGLCGLDPRRTALDGTEIRGCWVAAVPVHADAVPEHDPARELVLAGGADATRRAPRTFVPVDELLPRDGSRVGGASGPEVTASTSDAGVTGAPHVTPATAPANGWSLWGDPEG
jgi:hypothetical protein